ncbi:MAG: aldo/keto reductase, partial [Candidatus Tectomicrobia bacterium]|nr:aldo/keto reductase [Candidatus Tectomicrobia bacterium]
QMEYNILAQEAADVFSRAQAAGVGVIARVPLMRGLLSGRFNESTTFGDGDRRRQILAPEKLPAMVTRVRQITDLAAKYGLSLLDVAMRFCVSHPHAAVTIPGIRTPEQARTNAAACEPLPASLLADLRALA